MLLLACLGTACGFTFDDDEEVRAASVTFRKSDRVRDGCLSADELHEALQLDGIDLTREQSHAAHDLFVDLEDDEPFESDVPCLTKSEYVWARRIVGSIQFIARMPVRLVAKVLRVPLKLLLHPAFWARLIALIQLLTAGITAAFLWYLPKLQTLASELLTRASAFVGRPGTDETLLMVTKGVQEVAKQLRVPWAFANPALIARAARIFLAEPALAARVLDMLGALAATARRFIAAAAVANLPLLYLNLAILCRLSEPLACAVVSAVGLGLLLLVPAATAQPVTWRAIAAAALALLARFALVHSPTTLASYMSYAYHLATASDDPVPMAGGDWGGWFSAAGGHVPRSTGERAKLAGITLGLAFGVPAAVRRLWKTSETAGGGGSALGKLRGAVRRLVARRKLWAGALQATVPSYTARVWLNGVDKASAALAKAVDGAEGDDGAREAAQLEAATMQLYELRAKAWAQFVGMYRQVAVAAASALLLEWLWPELLDYPFVFDPLTLGEVRTIVASPFILAALGLVTFSALAGHTTVHRSWLAWSVRAAALPPHLLVAVHAGLLEELLFRWLYTPGLMLLVSTTVWLSTPLDMAWHGLFGAPPSPHALVEAPLYWLRSVVDDVTFGGFSDLFGGAPPLYVHAVVLAELWFAWGHAYQGHVNVWIKPIGSLVFRQWALKFGLLAAIFGHALFDAILMGLPFLLDTLLSALVALAGIARRLVARASPIA